MAGKTQFKLALAAGLAILCMAFNTRGATPYQVWLNFHSVTTLTGSVFSRPTNEVLLRITAFEGDDASPTNRMSSRGLEHVSAVSATGILYHYLSSAFGTKGGGIPRLTLSSDKLQQLEKCLEELPPDNGRLPPADRRVLLQANVHSSLVTRVYDRADLSSRILKIFRLAECHIEAWIPHFAAESKIDCCGYESSGTLALSPDRQQIVFAMMNQPLQFWDSTTHELVAEVRALPDVGSSIIYSPDGSLAVFTGSFAEGFCLDAKSRKVIHRFHKPRADGGIYPPSWPVFTADGRHLLLQYQDDLAVFDTASWQQIPSLPEIPPGALQYIPSPDTNRAVVTLKSGGVELWDVPHFRPMATLAKDVRLLQVSFSPEGLLFATVAVSTNDVSNLSPSLFQIWKSASGELAMEISLDGQSAWPEILDHLLWSHDGKYLLAAAHERGSGGGIDVFSVESGRLRAGLSGPTSGINGIALTPDGQLVAGGNDGKIYFWDFGDLMSKVKAFERSLAD